MLIINSFKIFFLTTSFLVATTTQNPTNAKVATTPTSATLSSKEKTTIIEDNTTENTPITEDNPIIVDDNTTDNTGIINDNTRDNTTIIDDNTTDTTTIINDNTTEKTTITNVPDAQNQPSLITKLNDLVNYIYNGLDFLAYGQINITLDQRELKVGQGQHKSDITDLKRQLNELKEENTLLKSGQSEMESQISLLLKGMQELVKARPRCEPSWVPFQNRCYKFVTRTVSAHESHTDCKRYGAQLATIRSQEHNDFIASLSATSVWIGLKREHRIFSWPDGTAFWKRYNNFRSGYPTYPSTSNCIFLSKGDKRWLPLPCASTAAGCVCERTL